jgi:hypothetical protein
VVHARGDATGDIDWDDALRTRLGQNARFESSPVIQERRQAQAQGR